MRRRGTLHVHLDEAGDLNFSDQGSRYYVFATAWTYSPLELAQDLHELRFDLLKSGSSIQSAQAEQRRRPGGERPGERFHAAEDRVETRLMVLDRLARRAFWWYAAVVVEKTKVPMAHREPLWHFYSRFAVVPLQFALAGPKAAVARRVVVFADRVPSECRADLTEKAVKTACRSALSEGTRFHYYSHSAASNAWLQVADYCAWAVFRKWERADLDAYRKLRPRLATAEWDVLRSEPEPGKSPR